MKQLLPWEYTPLEQQKDSWYHPSFQNRKFGSDLVDKARLYKHHGRTLSAHPLLPCPKFSLEATHGESLRKAELYQAEFMCAPRSWLFTLNLYQLCANSFAMGNNQSSTTSTTALHKLTHHGYYCTRCRRPGGSRVSETQTNRSLWSARLSCCSNRYWLTFRDLIYAAHVHIAICNGKHGRSEVCSEQLHRHGFRPPCFFNDPECRPKCTSNVCQQHFRSIQTQSSSDIFQYERALTDGESQEEIAKILQSINSQLHSLSGICSQRGNSILKRWKMTSEERCILILEVKPDIYPYQWFIARTVHGKKFGCEIESSPIVRFRKDWTKQNNHDACLLSYINLEGLTSEPTPLTRSPTQPNKVFTSTVGSIRWQHIRRRLEDFFDDLNLPPELHRNVWRKLWTDDAMESRICSIPTHFGISSRSVGTWSTAKTANISKFYC